jgi:amino acid adenylation domain-containing protein
MAVGLLGILKSGAAYVPLDPAYPPDRLAFLIDDAGIELLLTQRSRVDQVAGRAPQVVCLDTDWETIDGQSDQNPVSGVAAENLAYVIYTSGSTGKPKGVMLPHRAACNYLLWKKAYFQLGEDDRVLQRASFSFDDSVWEFFEPLMTGAAVVMLRSGSEMDSGYIVDVMMRERITVACFVPSMLRILLEEPRIGDCTTLRRFETGAEVLPVAVRDRFLEKLPVVLYNGYGPTEATVACTVYPCGPGDSGSTVPIGRPIANAQFYILGRRGQLVPAGAPGELCIGGAGLARGYLNRPELTAEKFIRHPSATNLARGSTARATWCGTCLTATSNTSAALITR